LVWLGFVIALAIVIGGIWWGLDRSARSPADPSSQTTGAGTAATPTQPTTAAPPEPGATDPIDKPESTETAPFDKAVHVKQGPTVQITDVEAVTSGRDVPGEQSGPAVMVVVRVQNDGEEAIDTGGVSVNLTYGGDDRLAATQITDDDSSVLPTSIAPGDEAEATYVFAVPLASDGDIRIIVDILASEPDVVFVGPRP